MEIAELEPQHREAVVSVASALPEWFDENARTRQIPTDVRFHGGFVALDKGSVVGFITLYVANGHLNISWMGVLPAYQRSGIGRALLHAAEGRAVLLGLTELCTYTLGDGVDYPPYQQTRSFYYKNGFRVYKRSQTDSPGCPEEIWLSKEISR